MLIEELRQTYHHDLFKHVLSISSSGIPNNADQYSKISVTLAKGIIEKIGLKPSHQRIASLALGTGDIDCVYHFALQELLAAANKLNNEAVLDILDTLVRGKRLRDISDLPFDLLI